MWRPNGPDCGFQPTGWPGLIDPCIPWTRPRKDDDPRLNPQTGGGRRLRHPQLDDLVYPTTPRIIGFDWDVLRNISTVVTRTEKATAVTRYPDLHDDPIITEIWDSGSAPIDVEFYRLLRQYWLETLATGDYIGWSPRDLSPYNYFIEIVKVQLGSGDSDEVQEHGDKEPFMLHQPLTFQFKLVQEARSPAGSIVFLGF